MGQKYSISLEASCSWPRNGRVHFSQYALMVLQLPITTPMIARRTKNRRRAWRVFRTCQVFHRKLWRGFSADSLVGVFPFTGAPDSGDSSRSFMACSLSSEDEVLRRFASAWRSLRVRAAQGIQWEQRPTAEMKLNHRRSISPAEMDRAAVDKKGLFWLKSGNAEAGPPNRLAELPD